MDDAHVAWRLAGGGLAIGLVLGWLFQRSRFCLVAAVANLRLIGDARQLAAYLAALAVAVAGTQFLEGAGIVAVAESGYRNPRLDWAGALLGGFLFGGGAIFAGGCAGRTVALAGEGSGGGWLTLAAFVIAAWAALFGFLEPWRVALVHSTGVEFVDPSLARLAGVAPVVAGLIGAAACAAGLVWLRHRAEPGTVAAGAAVGALVVAGWWVTGSFAQSEFDPVRPDSLTFSGPLGRIGAWLFSRSLPGTWFGPALVGGTLLGAAMSAAVAGHWRFTRPAPGRWPLHLAGGALMGVGAAFAGGCNIGNGLSGLAALSLKSGIAVAAIVTGMLAGLALLERYDRSPGG